jgi:hypothetical protein
VDRVNDSNYPSWGGSTIFTQDFPIPFPRACLNVSLTTKTISLMTDPYGVARGDYDYQILSLNKSSLRYIIQDFATINVLSENPTCMYFFAIGY